MKATRIIHLEMDREENNTFLRQINELKRIAEKLTQPDVDVLNVSKRIFDVVDELKPMNKALDNA
jgi:hypothetical protein